MHLYDTEHFLQYYRGCWIRNPLNDSEVIRVHGHSRVDHGAIFYIDQKTRAENSVPLAVLDWKHVSIPRLGYFNTAKGGKGLYYLTRKIGRLTQKGFNDHTVRVDRVPQFESALISVGGNAHKYIDGNTADCASTAQAVFFPSFTSLGEAVEAITDRADSIGWAISHEFAVVVGTTKQKAYVLLWKQIEVASSSDGKKWCFNSKEYEDLCKRNIKELN